MENPILFIIPGACALGSQIALEWAKIPYQVGVTDQKIRASEAFRKINPAGKVGALKDGKNVIGENLAILLYIADKYPQHNMCPPTGNYERAKVYQWLSYLSSALHPAFTQTLIPSRFISEGCTEQLKYSAYERLLSALTYIEKSFLTSGYLLTNKPTIVDAHAYALLRWSKGFKDSPQIVDLKRFQRINNFLRLMEEDLAVKNSLAIEKEHTSTLINSLFAGYYNFD